jgi:cellulose synthase/poly-beta-1,6-N-acetylglucosamine synthase-like glycosyltransferase
MLLSVVIPNLHSPVIDQTLAGLAAQTWPREQTEVVVVGLDKYGHVARFPFARHIATERPVSPARARNLGAQATTGEIIVFLDADGVPHPDWLARYAAWFAAPAVAVVGGGIDFRWDAPYWSVCENVSAFYPTVVSAPPGERPNLPTLNLAVRRAALEQVGLFDERYPKAAGEDTDLTVRLRLAGHTLHFDPRIVVEHRPPRTTLRAILRKAADIGYYSLKVDPRYADRMGFPHLLRHPWTLRLAAPMVAAGVTLNIYRQRPGLRRRLVWPGVYLAKLWWCWGAARRLVEQ